MFVGKLRQDIHFRVHFFKMKIDKQKNSKMNDLQLFETHAHTVTKRKGNEETKNSKTNQKRLTKKRKDETQKQSKSEK